MARLRFKITIYKYPESFHVQLEDAKKEIEYAGRSFKKPEDAHQFAEGCKYGLDALYKAGEVEIFDRTKGEVHG